MAALTTLDAVCCLMAEARTKTRRSNTAAKRIVRACRALDFDAAKTVTVLARLDYCYENGQPFGTLVDVCWEIPAEKERAK